MEPVSLSLAVVSLAGLFNNAIADFEYIQLGKNFAKDFEICRTKIACQQLRLSRWGAAIGINGDIEAAETLRDVEIDKIELATAEDCLGHIIGLFDDYRGKAKTYEDRNRGSRELVSDDSPKTRSLLERMHKFVEARQKGTRALEKVKWALYERKSFDRLLQDLQEHITDLVELWPGTKKQQQELCQEEANELSKEESVSQLVEIASEGDPDLEKAFGNAGSGMVSLRSGARIPSGGAC